MLSVRIIPCLLYRSKGLVKTIKFNKDKYIGDPINAIKIFNDKEVDELIFLDIDASKHKTKPNLNLIEEIASECFMPLSYGGGINNITDIKNILGLGVEKVIINTAAIENNRFIKEAVNKFGSSTIVISIDYKRNLFGNIAVYSYNGTQRQKFGPIKFAQEMQSIGVGEIMFNSIERDGMMTGYDIVFLKRAVESLSIPVIACGGAGSLNDIKNVVNEASVSAVAAGSLFVFYGPHKAVLINYPKYETLKTTLN